MEFEDKHNGVPGCVPEFGAIFMSNRATKRECFRRQLLGLPSSQADFVRQVKAGMLLFLFEFERRELHGVFQASSNGAMNIVPNAYCSSGKQFPAQVKFTPLWHCGPLSEDEFGDAIQENYYAAKKFNFGLSEDQVYKLLYIFSLRKLMPQRHLSDTTAFTSDSNTLPAESSVYNQLKPSSTFRHSIEPQVETLSRSTSVGLAVPYDPDAPGVDTRHSSSHEFIAPGIDTRRSSSHDFVAPGVDSRRSSSHDFVAPGIDTRNLSPHDFVAPLDSGFGCCVPVFSPNYYELSRRARMPILEATYSENMASDSGYIDRISEAPNHALSPSHIPSFVFDDKYHEASREKHDYEMLQCGINEVHVANVPMLKESRSQLQNHLRSVKIKSPDLQVNSSSKPEIDKTFGSLYSDYGKKRESVFSRLVVASKARVEEDDTLLGDSEDSRDTSINEVMSMLYQSRYKWLKMRKKQLTEDDASNFWRKTQTAFDSQSSKNHIQKISKEVKMTDIRASKESTEQFVEKTSFVDFRRRSEVRKTHKTDAETASCSGGAESDGISSGLRKRRKLIRPDFSKNELSDAKSINTDTPSVLLPDVSIQMSHADKKIPEAELDSDCKAVEMGEAAPPDIFDEDGKELTLNNGIRSMPSSVSCEDMNNITEQGPIFKNSMLDGLSQDLCNMSHFVGPESSPETCKRDSNRITSGETESCRGDEKEMHPNLDVDCNIAIGTVTDSSDQNPKSETTLSEFVCDGCKDCKMDWQQNVETCKRDSNGITAGETESCRGDEKEMHPNPDVDCNIAIDTVTDSSDQNPKSETTLDELVRDGCKDCKMDWQQNVETCKRDSNGITAGETESCRGDEKEMHPNPDVDCNIAIDTVTDSSDQNPKSETTLDELVRDGCKDCKMDWQQNVETCKRDSNGITAGETESCRGDEKEMHPNPDVDCNIAIDTVTDSSDQNPKSETTLDELVRDGCKDCKMDWQQNVETCRRDSNGITSGESDSCRGDEKEMHPNPDVDCNIAIDTVTDSSDQNPKSETTLGELVRDGCKDRKMDWQQNVETCKRDFNGITSGETESCRGDEKEMHPNPDIDCNIGIDMVTDSSDQNPKSETTLDELVRDGCKDCKIDLQQNVENENEVLSSSCEISAGICQTISSN